ncbi:TolC family protein [Chitinophaga sancti]|uniref:Outer membrane protein TolC n=1 Tax=Chitinophaga sancti TaxID=1004 RepID=A0A1K1MTA9_9BACT|nr:TolC family protein [Chitinophaga sancti]WQD62959.1 TolC family protein [Chitinophaga sancti]WQG91416.1 TolC family protein [Chitinophaga sancti]SFW26321.1 Outer membrane protein TolC [Chitinophaga sancti]
MKRFIIYLTFFILPGWLHAQQLTLKDAVSIALNKNLGLQIAENNVKIAQTNNNYAVAGGMPVVSASGTDVEQLTSLEQKYANAANNKSSSNARSNQLTASIGATVPIYTGSRVANASKRLEVAESISNDYLKSRVAAITYNVMLKYYDIIRQESYAATLGRSIEVSRQKLDIVKAQQSVGVANNADLFQAQVDLNTQVQNLQAQQLVIDQAKTDLLTVLTLKQDSLIVIKDTIVVATDLQLAPILQSMEQHPDLMAAGKQVQVDQYLEKETAAYRYPSLTGNAGYNFNYTRNSDGFSLLNQNYGPYVGVGVNIPVFNGSVYKRRQEIAAINTSNDRLVRDTLGMNYTGNIVKSWQAYNNNLQQLQTAKDNYELSGKLLELVLQRFQLKQATIIDVKTAQQSFENAGYLLINVSFAAKSAEIRLKYYGNQLSQP